MKFQFVSVFPGKKFDCLVIRRDHSPAEEKKVQYSNEAPHKLFKQTSLIPSMQEKEGSKRQLLIAKKNEGLKTYFTVQID